jgi:hypothetical protein
MQDIILQLVKNRVFPSFVAEVLVVVLVVSLPIDLFDIIVEELEQVLTSLSPGKRSKLF